MKLNPKHQQAILLLANGASNKEAAEQLDIAQETVSRWKSDFVFKAALNQQLSLNHEQSQAKLRVLTSTALETIEAIMLDDDAPARDRVTAAFKLLEITRLKQKSIGATSPMALQKEAEQEALLDSYGF